MNSNPPGINSSRPGINSSRPRTHSNLQELTPTLKEEAATHQETATTTCRNFAKTKTKPKFLQTYAEYYLFEKQDAPKINFFLFLVFACKHIWSWAVDIFEKHKDFHGTPTPTHPHTHTHPPTHTHTHTHSVWEIRKHQTRSQNVNEGETSAMARALVTETNSSGHETKRLARSFLK